LEGRRNKDFEKFKKKPRDKPREKQEEREKNKKKLKPREGQKRKRQSDKLALSKKTIVLSLTDKKSRTERQRTGERER